MADLIRHLFFWKKIPEQKLDLFFTFASSHTKSQSHFSNLQCNWSWMSLLSCSTQSFCLYAFMLKVAYCCYFHAIYVLDTRNKLCYYTFMIALLLTFYFIVINFWEKNETAQLNQMRCFLRKCDDRCHSHLTSDDHCKGSVVHAEVPPELENTYPINAAKSIRVLEVLPLYASLLLSYNELTPNNQSLLLKNLKYEKEKKK